MPNCASELPTPHTCALKDGPTEDGCRLRFPASECAINGIEIGLRDTIPDLIPRPVQFSASLWRAYAGYRLAESPDQTSTKVPPVQHGRATA